MIVNNMYYQAHKLYARFIASNLVVLFIYLMLSFLIFWKLFLLPGGQRLHLTSDFVHYWNLLYYVVSSPFGDILWDPYNYLGSSLISRIDLAIFYPPMAFFLLITKLQHLNPFQFYQALEILVVLHVGFGGFFAYLFASQVLKTKISAFVAGLIFAFSGFVLVSANAFPLVNATVWLPLFCLSLFKFQKTKHKLYLVLAGTFLSFTYLAGLPQITLYTFMYGSLFMIWQIFHQDSDLKSKLTNLVFFISITLVTTALIIAFPLALQIKAAKNSNRGQMEYLNTAAQGNIQTINTLDFVVPHFFEASLIGRNSFSSQNYLSIISLFALGMFPFIFKERKKYIYFASVPLFLLLGMGGQTLLHDLTYLTIPGVKFFRNISKYHFLLSFSTALVVGQVIDRLSTYKNLHQKTKLIIWQSLFGIAFLSGFFLIGLSLTNKMTELIIDPAPNGANINVIKDQISITSFQAIITVLTILLIYLLIKVKNKNYILLTIALVVFIDLSGFNLRVSQNNSKLDPAKAYADNGYINFIKSDNDAFRVTYLLEALPANYAPEVVQVENTDGYSSIIPLTANKLIDLRNKYQSKEEYSVISGIMNQKYVVSNETFNWPGYELAYEHIVGIDEINQYYCSGPDVDWTTCAPGKIFRVFLNKHYLPRISVLKQPQIFVASGPEKQLLALDEAVKQSADFSKFIVLDSEFVSSSSSSQIYLNRSKSIFKSTVEAKPGDILFLSYPFDSSLAITINDELVETQRANYAFHAYQIPKNSGANNTYEVNVQAGLPSW